MWSQFEICPDLLKLIRRDDNVKVGFPAKLVFALHPHWWNITDVAMITAIIFNLSPSGFSLANYRGVQMNKTTKPCCHAFLVPCPSPSPTPMRWAAGHLSPLLKLFPVLTLIGWKVPISLCTCKISCATPITLVISYATAIRSEW